MLVGRAVEAFEQLGVGREADALGLHRGVDRDPLEVLAAQRAGLVRDPQTRGQQQLQPVAELQWLRSERSCGNSCWKNSSPVKNWK